MFNKIVAVAAVACLAVGGIANANAGRMAAEQATKILQETQAGRQFAEALGIKFPKDYATLSQSQKTQFLSKIDMKAVEASLNAKPQAQGVLAKLAASTKGLTAKQAEAAAVKIVSIDGAALLAQAQAGTSAMNQIMGPKTAVADKATGPTCESTFKIPADVSGDLLGFACAQPLSDAAKARAVEIIRAAKADGNASDDGANIAAAVGGKEGAQYLSKNCLVLSNRLTQQISALR